MVVPQQNKHVINPRHTCAAIVTVLGLCVCLSVVTLVATLLVSTLKIRYVELFLRLLLDFRKNNNQPSIRKL